MKICHVSSVHISTDVRIAVKECPSLAAAGFDTYLVAKGESREENGFHVLGVGTPPTNRIKRIFSFSKKVFNESLKLDCEIYHLHDPELLRFVRKYKRRGKKVIFDSHEDVPAQIEDKYWIPAPLRKMVSLVYKCFETLAVKNVDAVVAATPYIAEQFKNRARRIVVVNNYPKLGDIEFQDKPFSKRESIVCYAGGISEIRGEKVMVEAMKNIDGVLILAGDAPHPYGGGNSNISYVGMIDRKQVNELYSRAIAGLCVLLPTGNYINSQPIKIFEYMMAGLPVIASDFPAWRKYVTDINAGICVSPNNVGETKRAIEYFLENKEEAQRMGENGRKAVEKYYCWAAEEEKLIELYINLRGYD